MQTPRTILFNLFLSVSLMSLLVVFSASVGRSQDTVTGAFLGTVTNSLTGVPITGAAVEIINEQTGEMMPMKNPCIMLEGVVCKAEYASCRLNCPRAIPSYWRESWLDRVGEDQRSHDEPNLLRGVAVNS